MCLMFEFGPLGESKAGATVDADAEVHWLRQTPFPKCVQPFCPCHDEPQALQRLFEDFKAALTGTGKATTASVSADAQPLRSSTTGEKKLGVLL